MRRGKTGASADEPLHIAEGHYLTKAQVARRYGVIHQTVQQWIDKGWLPSIKIPGLGHVIDAREVARFSPPRRSRSIAPEVVRSRRKLRQVEAVVRKGTMGDLDSGDLAYWRRQKPADRVLAVEAIKQEFYGQAYSPQSRLERVLAIVKRKGR